MSVTDDDDASLLEIHDCATTRDRCCAQQGWARGGRLRDHLGGVVMVADEALRDLPPDWQQRVRDTYRELRCLAAEIADPSAANRILQAAVDLTTGVRCTMVDLTPREIDVLVLVADGWSNRAVADRLGLTMHTVKSHMKNLMVKLEAETRLQAVVHARRLGALP